MACAVPGVSRRGELSKLSPEFPVADSTVFDGLLDPGNTSADVWADAAYRSKAREEALKDAGYRSHIHIKGQVGKPVTDCQRRANRRRSQVRSRVEHVFATQQAMGRKHVRTIGLARARVKVALTNLVYNVRRWCWLEATTP